jgi:hypothetical protein
MSESGPRVVPEYREQIPAWLDRWGFDDFVTLATNNPSLGRAQSGSSADYCRLRDLLRERDSRMHRKLVGRDWVRRKADRMWGFYFLEKPSSNPHWHALIRFCNAWPGLREKQQENPCPSGVAAALPVGNGRHPRHYGTARSCRICCQGPRVSCIIRALRHAR